MPGHIVNQRKTKPNPTVYNAQCLKPGTSLMLFWTPKKRLSPLLCLCSPQHIRLLSRIQASFPAHKPCLRAHLKVLTTLKSWSSH